MDPFFAELKLRMGNIEVSGNILYHVRSVDDQANLYRMVKLLQIETDKKEFKKNSCNHSVPMLRLGIRNFLLISHPSFYNDRKYGDIAIERQLQLIQTWR